MDKLPRAVAAVAADILPVGNTLGAAVDRLLERRRREARSVLLEELEAGRSIIETVEEIDEFAAITLRYRRAAEEGAARLNLRLMAMTIQGMSSTRTLTASRFLYYATFLATMSREEIIAAATLYRHERSDPCTSEETRGQPSVRMKAELIPAIFSTERHLASALQATTRTGLVVALPGWDALLYETTPLMEAVVSLAPFRDALEKERTIVR
jgi:hypothetical protein